MEKQKKLIFKPIGSLAGIGSNSEIKHFLNESFSTIGFTQNKEGLTAFSKYKGKINNREIQVSFTILRRTKYTGFGVDYLVKYRTYQGIRMRISIPFKKPTRLLITKLTQGKVLIFITNRVMKFKGFKKISALKINNFEREVWSPDKIFTENFLTNPEIENALTSLTNPKANLLSWGMITVPNQVDISFTFANLDDFETELLRHRMEKVVKIIEFMELLPISKKLRLTKSEKLAQNNPKAFLWRSLGFLFLFIVFGTGILIGILFFLANLIGMV